MFFLGQLPRIYHDLLGKVQAHILIGFFDEYLTPLWLIKLIKVIRLPTYTFFWFFLWFWPPRFQSLRIMGWYGYKPKHRIWLPLDSVPIFKYSMFPVRDDFGSFLSPPLQDSSGRLVLQHILTVSSLRLSFLPPLRPLTCIQPPPPIVRPPSSVRRRATNPPSLADHCPLPVSRPSRIGQGRGGASLHMGRWVGKLGENIGRP